MLKTAVFALLALCIAIPVAADWEMNEFMIFAGWPWDESVDEESRAKALSEIGFNTIMGDKDKLKLCRKYGLKLMVEGVTPEEASGMSGDSAVWGYMIGDEPFPADKFPGCAEQVKAFHKADPDHPSYINMIGAIGDFLQSYVDIVQPEILSYDYYQWWWGSRGHLWGNHSGHFSLLEEYRETALSEDIPLICWLEVNANPVVEMGGGDDSSPPSNNEQKLRQSVFTSLAYGVKGIEWFTSSLMFERGTNTFNQCGRDVEKINAELKHMGPVLINLRSVDVFHTQPLLRDTREAPRDHWVQVEGEEGGLVMGVFKDDNGLDYGLVANRNYHHEQQVVMYFEPPSPYSTHNTINPLVESAEILNKKTGEWIKIGGSYSRDIRGFVFYIEAGDGELLRLKKGK